MKTPSIQALLLLVIAAVDIIHGFQLFSWRILGVGIVVMWFGVHHWIRRNEQ